ncbi:MAG: universal stress protein [Acidaminococcaceae bacterium]
MLNRIMVAIDGSPLSFKALDFAMGLGKPFGSEIIVMYVAVPFNLSKMHSYEMEKLEDDILEKIKKKEATKEELTAGEKERAEACALDFAKKMALEAQYKKIEFKEIVDTEPAKTIIKQAALLSVDTIVMGTSGLGLMSAALLGSVSGKVLTNAHCPVIIVR